MDPQNISLQPQLYPQEQNITQQKPKFPSILLIGIIGVIVILLIGGGGYYLGTIQSNKQTPKIKSTPTNVVIPTQTLTIPDERSYWKTYTLDNKLSFKYPSSYLLTTTAATAIIAPSKDYLGPGGGSLIIDARFVGVLANYDKIVSLREKDARSPNYISKQKLSDRYIETWKLKVSEDNNFIYHKNILYKYLDAAIQVQYDTDAETVPVYDQILSTFKFLDQQQGDDTVTWKTYNNLGIYFKYPSNWLAEKFDVTGRADLHGVVELHPEGYRYELPIMPIFIKYWDNPEGLTVEEYDRRINENAAMRYPLYNNQAQVVSVGGLTALYEAKGDCAPTGCYKYVISSKNKIWEIASQYLNDPNLFKDTFNKLISTIKFQ